MKIYRSSVLIPLVTLLISHSSFAEFYISAAAGSTEYNEQIEDTTSLELSAGYRLNNSFAFEASWVELGETSIDINNTNTAEIGVDGTSASLITFIPLFPELELFAKIGVYYWEQESPNITTSTIIRSNNNESNSDVLYGGGFSWYASDNISLRAQYQEFDVLGENIKNVSAGFIYSF